MSKVHLFPVRTSIFPDTRIPSQYPGNGESPTAIQFEASTLLAWLIDNLSSTISSTVSSGGTIVVPSGRLVTHIAIVAASGARTVKIGTSAGADDVMELTGIPTGTDYTLAIGKFSSSTTTLYFTITGGTAAVKVFTQA